MKLSLFLIILFLTQLCSAVRLSISPQNLEFTGQTGEEICNKITLFGEGVVEGLDKWAEKESRDIRDYNFVPSNLVISYPESIRLNEDKTIRICINTTSSGKYYGALIYNQNYIGVGTWIKVVVKGANYTKNLDSPQILTGAVIGANKNQLSLIIICSVVFLLICIIFLLIKLRNHNNLV